LASRSLNRSITMNSMAPSTGSLAVRSCPNCGCESWQRNQVPSAQNLPAGGRLRVMMRQRPHHAWASLDSCRRRAGARLDRGSWCWSQCGGPAGSGRLDHCGLPRWRAGLERDRPFVILGRVKMAKPASQLLRS
jgi:hypothetical protein